MSGRQVLTQAELAAASCSVSGCAHDHGGELWLHGRCHPTARLTAKYSDGVLNVYCGDRSRGGGEACGKLVAAIAVAPAPAPPPPDESAPAWFRRLYGQHIKREVARYVFAAAWTAAGGGEAELDTAFTAWLTTEVTAMGADS